MNLQTRNTLWAVVKNLVTIFCGLVLPREILSHYGSEMNGVLHSVSQFLSYTVVLELGIGAVIPAALYPSLVEGNREKVSAILSSGYKVFRKVAIACTLYILLLILIFPELSGVPSSALLILVLGLGTVMHYTIGKPEELLIISDQKGYVIYRLATVGVLLSTALQVILIRAGQSLATVKLAGTAISILQIAGICLYAKKHYNIDRKTRYTKEPIPQKWNGIAQHIAYFILKNTDIILLTLFTGFREVSVYSVYFMVISGVRVILATAASSVQPKLGELKAKGNQEELNRFFAFFERWIHRATTLSFGILSLLLTPFVKVYTEGIMDADYVRPVFAALLAAAYGIQCIRDPYDKLILACGHFRQTQKNYIIASCLNLGISLIAVQFWGLEGVAAGTLIAMIYQLIYMAAYDTKVILKQSGKVFLRRIVEDIGIIAILIIAHCVIQLPLEDWFRQILSIIRI